MFRNAIFSSPVYFNHSTFYHETEFKDSVFSSISLFSHSKFLGDTSFDRSTFDLGASFNRTEFSRFTSFFVVAFGKGSASFRHATFHGRTIFAQASFKSPPSFTGVHSIAAFEGSATVAGKSWPGPGSLPQPHEGPCTACVWQPEDDATEPLAVLLRQNISIRE